MKKKPHGNTGKKRADSAQIGRLFGGNKEKENLLYGLANLDEGTSAEDKSRDPYYPSMRAAALGLKIDYRVLKDARLYDCPAFRSSGKINRLQLVSWLRRHGKIDEGGKVVEQKPEQEESEFIDSYEVLDEVGGVGQTLKSLQAYERRAKRKLDEAERSKLPAVVKEETVKLAQDAWIKVVNALLKYDLNVTQAKRESGELIPIADAREGVQALMAWQNISVSDALRNIIPQLEGLDKYQIAAILDPALRGSIYRNFKLGRELNKIPEWMEKSAVEAVKTQPVLRATPKVDLSDF